MTLSSATSAVLQASFLIAAALTWVAVVILAKNLRRHGRREPVRDLPAGIAGQAALLFAGACLVTATVTRNLGSGAIGDLFLYAAVFGGAAATVTWAAEGPVGQARPAVSTALRALAFAAPVAAGVLAGAVGTP